MITIVDYGLGNLESIKNMLKKIGVKSEITSDVAVVLNAEKLILPGVGSFDYGMKQLAQYNLIEVLNHKVQVEKKPILGICLGMQLFTKKSEEGICAGLGWIDANTIKYNFEEDSSRKIPHMGWNTIQKKKESKLLTGFPELAKFYFVHSYYVNCEKKEDILLSSNYGIQFTCAIEKDNILGVQFHPEKSHKFGIQLLKNFAELY